MGIFNKIKNMFKQEEKKEQIKENAVSNQRKEVDKEKESEKKVESVKIYEKGLTKSRENFVSKLINLTNKYHKVTEEYFDELEEILMSISESS